jgi:hypothetical protein
MPHSPTKSPRLTVTHIAFSERRVPFRTPFRFGAVTVEEAAQLFVHAEIEVDGRKSKGAAAELMVPKWFNKAPRLSAEQTVVQLRQSAAIARDIYLERRAPDTAFGHHAASLPLQVSACAKSGIPALAALFGAAEIDKAILDALLRACETDFFNGMRDNLPGIDARLTPDLDAGAIAGFMSSRTTASHVAIRYTIGMLDSIASVRVAAAEGYRYFKIKFSGDPAKDRARLIDLAGALSGIDYRATVDANEQYRSLADLQTIATAIANDPALAPFTKRLLYIEQPFAREDTWNFDLGALGQQFSFIIDEADDSYDAFPRARALGYRGVSSKSCKGLYKSILNGVRAAAWGGQYFVSAEDLTCQAGLALQQDTALVAFHGLSHAERNGHHYVDGFVNTPEAEALAFLAAHADLYRQSNGRVSLIVNGGAISTRSLACPGFACALAPQQIGPHAEEIQKVEEYGA